MKFTNFITALMLAVLMSMCMATPIVDAKGILVGDQVYGGSRTSAAAPVIDNSQVTNVNIFGNGDNTVIVGQQAAKSESPSSASLKSDVSAAKKSVSAAKNQVETTNGCLETDCTEETPASQGIPYDYVCIMKGNSPTEEENFYWVIGLFIDTLALDKWDGDTSIYTDAKLRDALVSAGDVVSGNADERADQIRQYWEGPIVVTSNNRVYLFAVADHNGMTIECFRVGVDTDGKYKLTSIGWKELQNSGAQDNVLVNDDGSVDNRIKSASAKQWK